MINESLIQLLDSQIISNSSKRKILTNFYGVSEDEAQTIFPDMSKYTPLTPIKRDE